MATKVRKTVNKPTRRVHSLALARVLIVDDNPASRLTLKTVLEAGGYSVDSAASAAEAFDKMDQKSYELVLSDLQMESPEAGLKVLARARIMEYQPATALVTAYHPRTRSSSRAQTLTIETLDVPEILTKVANLISARATRRLERQLRQATVAG
ncbi:MAG: response regulator [Bryobacteraceae bacterium]|nr:response regulator [Bryobacteraceae bacterium]MDW8380329.1 response regulator [Bryobacterales bacterium]